MIPEMPGLYEHTRSTLVYSVGRDSSTVGPHGVPAKIPEAHDNNGTVDVHVNARIVRYIMIHAWISSN